ncbi:MAG: sugar ABC transporter permease, partial [bacterium]
MIARQVEWRQIRHHWEVSLLVLPTLILIALFQYYPAASGAFHSFFRWNGSDISEWVGVRNYKD